jgi:hypothetical protein
VSGLTVTATSSQTPASALYHFTVNCSVRSSVSQTSSGIVNVRVMPGSKVAPAGLTS